ncbi:acylphosphatase [Nitrosophilus alvini]|uniref:acylphosphatase n=1 Tax=Nitrosophilus alvini TaxID=2714855 RepID=UPI001909D8A1|nr:acylphosphatase [Nitrosophilus alvini]
MKSYRFIVSGRVQGVWFRKYTKELAENLGISGYVRNLPDGRVEAAATFEDDEKFRLFLEGLKKGSPLSRVEKVEIEPIDDISDKGFEIIY